MVTFLLVLILLAVLRLFWPAVILSLCGLAAALYVYLVAMGIAVMHEFPSATKVFWATVGIIAICIVVAAIPRYYKQLRRIRSMTTPEQRGWH